MMNYFESGQYKFRILNSAVWRTMPVMSKKSRARNLNIIVNSTLKND